MGDVKRETLGHGARLFSGALRPSPRPGEPAPVPAPLRQRMLQQRMLPQLQALWRLPINILAQGSCNVGPHPPCPRSRARERGNSCRRRGAVDRCPLGVTAPRRQIYSPFPKRRGAKGWVKDVATALHSRGAGWTNTLKHGRL